MDFSEKWGKDIEDAVKLALQDLKVERDQVKVIVLEEPSKGFFGIGSKLAKVRVEKIEQEEEIIKEEPKKVVQEEISSVAAINKNKERPKKQKNRKKTQKTTPKKSIIIKERPDDLVEITDSPAFEFLKDVTNRMGLNVSIEAYGNDSSMYFDIFGPDSGTIIGKRGQTLDSIQYLTSLVANKNKEKYLRVIVDAENYRSKRERTLEQLANRLGDKVQRSGKSIKLEPMNPYERKVIHATLQKNSAIATRSEGEEPYRRVIIERK
jgi:spoIIIJ-associated protein